jgi:hypothetical protein
MKKRNFVETICVKISKTQRTAIEALAESDDLSIGGATRELLNSGIKVKGLA